MIVHDPACGHVAHGASCGLERSGAVSCSRCADIVAAKSAGRDDMLVLLEATGDMQVMLAAQNAAAMCVYTLPTPLEEM